MGLLEGLKETFLSRLQHTAIKPGSYLTHARSWPSWFRALLSRHSKLVSKEKQLSHKNDVFNPDSKMKIGKLVTQNVFCRMPLYLGHG